MDVTIRPLEALNEYQAVEDLQRQVWAMPDDLEVVPLHLLLSVHKNGGLLLGAFDGDELVGFVFGFPGFTDDGRPQHCSHMMGVSPDVQGQGIGYQLKLAQRECALAQGFDLVAWTYDPLESRNANLNVHKLGAVCQTYIRDLYGPLDDGLNRGLPSDRFQVAWWIASELVQRRLSGRMQPVFGQPAVQVNATKRSSAGLLAPGALTLDADAPSVQLEIPPDYQAIKAADPALALAWRLATREIFEALFAAGYAVSDFVSHAVGGERCSYYILSRR
jgi:predicted GNAT superfamily acetyltransferase